MKRLNLGMKKSRLNRIFGKRIVLTLLILVLMLSVVGCQKVVINNSNEELTKTVPFRKQPEPQEPLIQGHFLGLTGDELIRFYIKGLGGQRGTWHGNGPWESVISNAREGERYEVTADVPGYQSSPPSYTIVIAGKKAYMVEGGQVTSKEATKLDFQFTPMITPTGD